MSKFKTALATYFKLPPEVMDAAFAENATDDAIAAVNKAIVEQSKASILNDPETAKHFEKSLKGNIFGEVTRKIKEIPGFDPADEVVGDYAATLKNVVARVEANAKKSGAPEPTKELEALQKKLNETQLELQKAREQEIPAAVAAKEAEFRREKMLHQTEAFLGSLKNLKVAPKAAVRMLENDLKDIDVVEQNGKMVPQKGGNLINRIGGAGVYDDYNDYVKDLASNKDLDLFASSPGAGAGPQSTPGADGGTGGGGDAGKIVPLPGNVLPGGVNTINPAVAPAGFYDRSAEAAAAAARLSGGR